MGRNKRAKKQSEKESLISSSAVCKAVDDLWELLKHNSSEQLVSLWEEYDKIQAIVKRLQYLQGKNTIVPSRMDKIPTFEKWLRDHGAVYASLDIVEIHGTGLGLRCTAELKCEEKVLEIPEKLMLSSLTALKGVLGSLIYKDQMLQSMPNVSLALHLLNEKCSCRSFWKPYIDTLPSSFTLPLYFSKQELQLLKGSPCLVKSLLQIRNIVKLYSHLHKLIRAMGEESLPIFESGFLYDDFIWAVSCVMSRQNEIPSKSGLPSPTLALIPLWDLCNHCSGRISTYFNVESSTCDCYAQCDFKANEEFRIFYGPRTNSELLLQQGFVYLQNESDSYPVKLGLSSMEDYETKSLKIQLLQAISIPLSGSFFLFKSEGNPFSSDLQAFVRIFTAPLDMLKRLLDEKETLESYAKNRSWQGGDLKALEFLEKRCSLLLRSYPESISEDEQHLKSESTSACSTQAILMRMCEKKLLLDASNYAVEKQIEITKHKSIQL